MRNFIRTSAVKTTLIAAFGLPIFLVGCDSTKHPDTPTPTPTPTPSSTYTVGGTVSGLNGSVTLANNGGNTLTVNANGTFTFTNSLAANATYVVTVATQPANQTCMVASGAGSIASSNVTNVSVTCTQLYTIGGTISGLSGSITLANNGGNALTANADGAFIFTTPLAGNAAYAVTVTTQPTNQQCTLTNAFGTIAGANVTNIAIACDTFQATASIGAAGGTLTGPDGVQVVIPPGALAQSTTIGIKRNTAGAPTPFLQNAQASGSVYELTPHDTIFSRPVLVRFPVASGTTTAQFAISSFGDEWRVAPAFLNNNYAEVERDTFSWFTLVGACVSFGNDPYPCSFPSGNAFITASPAGSATMTSGSTAIVTPTAGSGIGSGGTWAVNSNTVMTLHFTLVFNGAPDCTAGHATLRKMRPGTTALLLTDQPTTPNSNGDGSITLDFTPAQLGLDNFGTHAFSYSYHCTRPGYSSGSSYTVGGADWLVLNTSPGGVAGFTIGGSVSGLGSASGLELRNGNRDFLPVPANSTSFTFDTALVAGLPYNVTVRKQPTGALCTVQNGSGTVTTNVSNVAVTCTPTTPPSTGGLVLVPNTGSNNISIYRRDTLSGALSALGTTGTGNYPFSIVVTPDGKYAYVSNLVSATISSFAINKAAGTLTLIPLSSPGTTNPYGVAMDPLGRFIFVANYTGHTVSAFAINSANGVLTSVGSYPTGTFPYAVAVHPNGTHVYVVNESGQSVSMFSVNSATGGLTSIGTLSSVGVSMHSIAVTPNAKFAYALTTSSIARLAINSSTGVLTISGATTYTGSSASGTAHGLAVHPSGQFLFMNNQNSVQAFAIDSGTGNLTAIGSPTLTGSGTYGIALDPTGAFLYVVNTTTKTVTSFIVDNAGGLTASGSLPTGNSPQGIATTP